MVRFYTMRDSSAKPGSIRTGAAALVHAYTASGAVLAFVGTRAVVDGDVRLAFAMMLAATLVDATDGALARLVRIKEVLPSVDGAKIDDLVDYISFVFLPLFLIDMRGGLPARAALPVVAVVLISSAYGFAAVDAKSTDHFFTGFPSYWNIVVFYLMAFRLPPAFNAAALLVLSALIFIRTGYVYPTRTGALRGLTLTLAAFWTALLAWMIWRWPDVPRNLAIGSLLFPVYYFVLSVVLHVRRRVLFA